METKTMGKVVVTAMIENLEDLYEVERGLLPDDQVRRIEVPDAMIDTGATTLLLPKRMIAAPGPQSPARRAIPADWVVISFCPCMDGPPDDPGTRLPSRRRGNRR